MYNPFLKSAVVAIYLNFNYNYQAFRAQNYKIVSCLQNFLQNHRKVRTVSATCSRSHFGVDVAPQTPTLSSLRNHSFLSSFAASVTSGAATTADTTAIPSIPSPLYRGIVFLLIPPIMTMGMETALRIAFSVSIDTESASLFVAVGFIAPTPR